MSTFVVVSGLPASGKTTLACSLAKALGLVHLDKDAFLERLLDETPVDAPEGRARLSRRADVDFQRQAMGASSAVLSSWWRHPKSRSESGTPVSWLTGSGRTLAEVHCRCPAPEAVRRFQARARHPGHFDALRSPEALLSQFEEAEALGPLFPAQAIVFDTSRPTTEEMAMELLRQVGRRLAAASSP